MGLRETTVGDRALVHVSSPSVGSLPYSSLECAQLFARNSITSDFSALWLEEAARLDQGQGAFTCGKELP